MVPVNTKIVPIQWKIVKEFLKYNIEKRSETNLRSVTTKVTVKELHSAVKTYTELMQTY